MSILQLPTKKVFGTYNFQELVQFYYGPPGIGKTTFASRLPQPNLFIATEDGQRALNCFCQRVNTWQDFLDVIKLLEKGQGKEFFSVTVDTVDNLFTFCEEEVCRKLRITHMSDADWGKGWDALRKEFKSAINRLQAIGIGSIFISHAEEREIKTRSLKIDKWFPTISKGCRKVLIPLVDEQFFFTQEETVEKGGKIKTVRKVLCQPGETWEAKDRMGAFPEEMPMDPLEFVKVYKQYMKVNQHT